MPIAGPPGSSLSLGDRLLTRRRGLVLLTVLGPIGLLAACSSESVSTPTVSASDAAAATPGPASDVAAEERQLIALYDATISELPAGPSPERTLLERIRGEHAAHLSALTDASGPTEESVDLATAPVSLRDLIGAERRATRSRVSACVETSDPELARVLALIGASEAGHVAALRSLS